jgi:hypothetical protein
MRASILVDSVVGLAASTLISAVLLVVAGGSFQFMSSGVDASDMQSSIMRFRSDAQGSADDAIAVFIPAKDVFGNSNTVAFGTAGSSGNVTLPNSSAHEFDTFTEPLGTVSSEAFYYSISTGLVRYRYLYRRPSDGVAMCSASTVCNSTNIQIVRDYSNCGGFSAAYYTVPNLPSIDPLAAAFQQAHPGELKDVVVQTGYSSDVISGNRLVVYNLSCAAGNSRISEQVQLVAGTPLSTGKEPVTFTPPPIGGMALSASPNPLILGYAGANSLPSSGTITASVTNYHHDFTLNGTTVGLDATKTVSCGGISTETLSGEDSNPSGSPNNPPSSFPGMWMQFGASADAVGSCTATFSTLSGLQAPDNVVQSGNVTIVVQGDLTISGNPSPFTICGNPSCSGTPQTGTVTVSMPGYSGSITISNACSSYLSGAPASVTLSNGSASFTVSGTNPTPSGGCSITAVAPTSNGQSLASGNASLPVTVIAPEPLTVMPYRIVFGAASGVAYQQFSPGRLLNQLLGGDVALASGCAGVYAYDSSGNVVANNAALGTDSKGCFAGAYAANLQASEPNYSGSFGDASKTCQQTQAQFGPFSPSSGSSTATLPVGMTTLQSSGFSCWFYVYSSDHPIPSNGTVTPYTAQLQDAAVPYVFPQDSGDNGGPYCDPSTGERLDGISWTTTFSVGAGNTYIESVAPLSAGGDLYIIGLQPGSTSVTKTTVTKDQHVGYNSLTHTCTMGGTTTSTATGSVGVTVQSDLTVTSP